MAKQLELNFNDKTPSFMEWLIETNSEHRKNEEKEYSVSEGVEVYKRLVKSNFFNTTKNFWNSKNEN